MNNTKTTSKLLNKILWKFTLLDFIKYGYRDTLKTDEYDQTGAS